VAGVSVVTRRSRRRWGAVALGVAVLLALLTATSSTLAWAAARSRSTQPAPVLVQRVLASAARPYSGLAEIRGGLSLPDLPRLGDLVARLGGTTRARVWWAGPPSWRVAQLSLTGEQATYRSGDRLVQWDYEQSRLTDVITLPSDSAAGPGSVTGGSRAPSVRLPRTDDLLPPQAARRLLAAVGPGDRVDPLPGARLVAGVSAQGLRVAPGDPRSTIGHVDVWVDPGSGIPVQVTVVDTRGATALTSAFLDLSQESPSAQDVAIPPAPGAVHDSTTTPDLASRIQQVGPWQLPPMLAGLPASSPVVGGTATYGSGLARFIVLPLSGRLSGAVFGAAHDGGAGALKLARGDGLSITSGMLCLVVARGTDGDPGDPQHAYLITGLVSASVLADAAQQLLSHPPPRRSA
jgi:hypothetical protein